MTIDEFIDKCLDYNIEHNIDVGEFEVCPAHVFAAQQNKSCHDVLAGIDTCKLCEEPMCPRCGNHNVTQVSRVTGYMSDVGGWNKAKRQELIDRQRYNISDR